MFTPGVSAGIKNVDAPVCTGTSGSVIATTMKNDATDAFDDQYLRPLMTQSSASRTALVVNTRGSDPPCGSVIEKVEKISPDSRPVRYRSFCSSVPNRARISALPVSGACVPKMIDDHVARPRISLISVSLTAPKPCPPSSGPRCGAHNPWSRTCCLSGSTILRRSSLSGRNSQPGKTTSSGSISSRTKSRIHSSFSSNSGSVEKSHAIVDSLRDAAVGPKDRAGCEAGCVGHQEQCGADDFSRLAGALQGVSPERIIGAEVPRLADVGEERPGHQRVDSHGRSERRGQALGHRVQTGLRGRVGDERRVRPQRAVGADVNDHPTAVGDHTFADQRRKTKRAFKIQVNHRVEQLLADVGELVVGR